MKLRKLLLGIVLLAVALLVACTSGGVKKYIEGIRPEGFSLGKTIQADLDADGKIEHVVTFTRGKETQIHLVQRGAKGYVHDHLHTAEGLEREPEIINLDTSKVRFVLISHGPRQISSVELQEGYSIYGLHQGKPHLIDEYRPLPQKTRTVGKVSNRWLVFERFVCDDVQGHIIGITYAWQEGRFVSLGEGVSYPNKVGPVYTHITEPEKAIRGYIEANSLKLPREVEGYLIDKDLRFFSPMQHYPHGSPYEKGSTLKYEVLTRGENTAFIRAYQEGTPGLFYSLSSMDGIWRIERVRDNFDDMGWRWFTTQNGKIRLLHAAKLTAKESDGGLYITHSVPHVHDNPCDLSGIPRPPLKELTDFKVFIKHYNQPFATVIKAHNFGQYLVGNTLKTLEGFIAPVNTSFMDGYRITSQAEGCGVHEYFFKLQDGTTLYVGRSIVPYFNTYVIGDSKEYEKLAGVILPPEEEELFDSLLSSIIVKTASSP